VTVPLTGDEIVAEPHACPVGGGAGVEVVLSGALVVVSGVPGEVVPGAASSAPPCTSPSAASSWPARSNLCSTCRFTSGGTFEPPIDAPLALWLSNSAPQVARPTIPSTSRPAERW
jgi:hypothetical protein